MAEVTWLCHLKIFDIWQFLSGKWSLTAKVRCDAMDRHAFGFVFDDQASSKRLNWRRSTLPFRFVGVPRMIGIY